MTDDDLKKMGFHMLIHDPYGEATHVSVHKPRLKSGIEGAKHSIDIINDYNEGLKDSCLSSANEVIAENNEAIKKLETFLGVSDES